MRHRTRSDVSSPEIVSGQPTRGVRAVTVGTPPSDWSRASPWRRFWSPSRPRWQGASPLQGSPWHRTGPSGCPGTSPTTARPSTPVRLAADSCIALAFRPTAHRTERGAARRSPRRTRRLVASDRSVCSRPPRTRRRRRRHACQQHTPSVDPSFITRSWSHVGRVEGSPGR